MNRKSLKSKLKIDLFKFQSFLNLVELLRPLALYLYNTKVVLGVVDTMAVLVIHKIFTKYSNLADMQQTARDFLNNSIERDSITAKIADKISINKLVAVVGGVIMATYNNPPALNSRMFSLMIAELKASILAKLFQIAWQIVQLDTVEETWLFLAGFTALHPEEVLKHDNALHNIELQATGEPINVSKVITPCKTPPPEETVCTIY